MKTRNRTTITLRTKTSINKYIVVGASFSLLIGFACYLILNFGNTEDAKAAGTQQSKSEFSGEWENTGSWASNQVPGTSDNYVINGSIKKGSSLSLGNLQSLTVKTGDTLIIEGNLFLANKSSFTIESNAVVIVKGNFETHQQTTDRINGDGTLIITGELSFFGGGSDIFIAGGGILYYDESANGDISDHISGAGSVVDVYSLQGILFDMSGIKTLPVNVESFYAKAENKGVHLNWKSNNEGSLQSFTIQKSKDGIEFQTIGQVEPGKEDGKYTFIDEKSETGRLYYRIVLSNGEGKPAYSPITEIDISKTIRSSFKLFPTVSTGEEINFKTSESNSKSLQVVVYDLQGKAVYSNNVSLDYSASYNLNFNQKLDRGNYFIHFVQGKVIEKQKFVVSY